MATVKISQLPATASPEPADLVPVVQSASTKKITRGDFLKNIDADATLTDIATNNVSTSKHGFAPKLPNDATKYLDGTGAYSVPAGSGGGGSGALALIETQTITSAVQDVTFSGLDGDTDGVYFLLYEIVNSNGSQTAYTIEPNGGTSGLTSATNFWNSGGAGVVGSSSWAIGINDSNPSLTTGSLTINAGSTIHSVGRLRTYHGQAFSNAGLSATASGGNNFAGIWNDTSTNITSLVIHADHSSGIGDGSRLSLYKYAH